MHLDQGTSQLSSRQRFALFHNVIAPASASAIPDADIDAVLLRAHHVPASNLRAARITALDLKRRGIGCAIELRELGFDALDLTNAAFCSSCVSAFGAEAVRRAFLLEAGDAVALAGSVATFQLDLSAKRLLESCAGVPAAAKAVLQQLEPRGGALQGVPARILLDAGLRAKVLVELGYHAQAVMEQTGANGEDIVKLGF